MILSFQTSCKIFLLVIVLLSSLIGLPNDCEAASDEKAVEDIEINAQILPTVTVESTRLDPLIGASTLSRELITQHPNRNGTINELLSIMPGVQFSEEKDSSFTGGEIQPPNLSISGGRANQNNFVIDGISNNSLLDPLFDTPNSQINIPGHPQEFAIGTNLVEQVTVYEHNIPAHFGGFSGGVVETETKDPSPTYEGKVQYRTTQESWSKFHIDVSERDKFYNSNWDDRQPEFKKHFLYTEANIPLNRNSGLLASYEQRYSKIPLNLLAEKQKQSRRTETYFLKYLLEPSESRSLRLTVLYSPYEEKRFLKDTKDSQFILRNDAWALSASYRIEEISGDAEIKVSYKASQDRRKASNTFISWDSDDNGTPTSKDWGNLIKINRLSKEGGLGNFERTQESLNIGTDWKSTPITHGALAHTLEIGLEIEALSAKLTRQEDATSYQTPKLENVICATDDIACVSGEQYLSKRKIFSAASAKIRVNQYNLYAEDNLAFKQLTIRPGIRYSYDDLMENHNFAPRLAASYDIFNNKKTLLVGGLNRYYDRSMITFKLREGILPFTQQKRTYDATTQSLSTWADSAYISPLDTKFSKLVTPHTDEQSIALDQSLYGGRILLEYIQRQYANQLAREIDPYDPDNKYEIRHITLNNNGSKDYKSYRLSWERQWPKNFLSVNIAYEEVESSNESYDENFDDEDLLEQVWYRGHLIYTKDLPRENFSRPWTSNLTWITKLPYRLTFTNVVKYQSHYKRIDDTNQNASDGNDIYDKVSKPSFLTFDWRFAWESEIYRKNILTLSMDIYNVFNRKNVVGTQDDQYAMGRQFWAGVEILF